MIECKIIKAELMNTKTYKGIIHIFKDGTIINSVESIYHRFTKQKALQDAKKLKQKYIKEE